MDIGKAFGAAKVPIVIIFFIAIIRWLMFPFLSAILGMDHTFGILIACIVVPMIIAPSIILYLWLGQLIYKAKLGIVDAVLVGWLTGAVEGIITGVMLIVINLLGIGTSMLGVGFGMVGIIAATFGLGFSFIGSVLVTIILSFIGLTLSALGYLVGGVERK
ncbi:MAG: hypothetical protein ACPL06_04565 [Candidatus Anstonellales archaeon]